MNQLQFLKEAYVMKNFSHENVMQLIGICLEAEETPLVVLPFMEHGDLLSYLHEDKHVSYLSIFIRPFIATRINTVDSVTFRISHSIY